MYKKKLCDMNHTAECRMAGGHYFVVQAISTWLKQTKHSYHTDQSFVVIWLSRGMKFWTKR